MAGLHAGYGPVQVLRGVDIRIAPGEIVGVGGLNGAGKTTLLRALSGVIPRTCERALSAGRSLPARPEDVARAGIVHVPEGRQVFRELSVLDNLRYGAAAVARPETGVLDSVLEHLPPAAGVVRPPGRTAQRRRAADARHRPRTDGPADAAHGR